MLPTTQNDPNQSAGLPSETVRGLVSLFLVIHLTMVVLAFGSYTTASALQARLVETFAPYLRTFNFDLVHTYSTVSRLHLTHAEPSDVDFTVKAEAKSADGKLVIETLPQAKLWPRIRLQREQTLANVVGGLCQRENEDLEAILPRAIASRTLRSADAQTGRIIVTAHYLQNIEELAELKSKPKAANDASFFRPVYDARAIAGPAGVDLLKTSKKGESAPVTIRGGSTGQALPSSKQKE